MSINKKAFPKGLAHTRPLLHRRPTPSRPGHQRGLCESPLSKIPDPKKPALLSLRPLGQPVLQSHGDTVRHAPVLTYYVYTKAHRIEQEKADVPRIGIYAAWHPVHGQPDETPVYREANQEIGKPHSSEMIAKGHCQAWILMAWCADAAILSDTYTFNAGMEFQGQNVGTEEATEELCRKLTGVKGEGVTDSVKIWCGTFGSAHTYTEKGISVTVPTHYYKIISYKDQTNNKPVLLCYWMPNAAHEKKDKLAQRLVSYATLVHNLGFDPMKIFH